MGNLGDHPTSRGYNSIYDDHRGPNWKRSFFSSGFLTFDSHLLQKIPRLIAKEKEKLWKVEGTQGILQIWNPGRGKINIRNIPFFLRGLL